MDKRKIISAAVVGLLIPASLLTLIETGFPAGLVAPLRGLFAALIFLLSSRRLGGWAARAAGVTSAAPDEALGLGLILYAAAGAVLGALGLFSPILLAILAILPALGLPREITGDIGRIFRAVSRLREDEGGRGLVFLSIGALGLLWAFLSTLAPPVGMDSLTYTLGVTNQYLIRGSTLPWRPDLVYLHYTQIAEMITAFPLALDPSGIGPSVFLGFFLPLSAVIARRLGGSSVAFLAVATSPLLAITVAHSKTEALGLFFILLGVGSLRRHALIPALYLGAAAGIKITYGAAALPAAVFLLYPLRRSPARFAAAVVFLAAPAGYFLVRNLIYLGNPLEPFLAFEASIPGHGILFEAARFIGSFLLNLHSDITGPIGPLVMLLFLLSPLALAGKERREAVIGLSGTIMGIARCLVPRLYLPAILVSAISSARLLPRGRAATVIVSAAAVISVGSSVAILEANNRFMAYLSGGMNEEEYMEKWLRSFETQAAASRILPDDAYVVSIGEPRLFYLGRKADFDAYFTLPRAVGIAHRRHDPADLAEWMRAGGYTHILYYPPYYRLGIEGNWSPPPPCGRDRRVIDRFLEEYTSPVIEDARHDCRIYRFEG